MCIRGFSLRAGNVGHSSNSVAAAPLLGSESWRGAPACPDSLRPSHVRARGPRGWPPRSQHGRLRSCCDARRRRAQRCGPRRCRRDALPGADGSRARAAALNPTSGDLLKVSERRADTATVLLFLTLREARRRASSLSSGPGGHRSRACCVRRRRSRRRQGQPRRHPGRHPAPSSDAAARADRRPLATCA
jgi:hypothetical protein